MTAAVLLDHVRAYAAAVRSHLVDLTAEQVEDLTDGLEADLADAIEDTEGPVVTGEIPIGRPSGPVADDGESTSILDLTQRFGPASAYAAELRTAAGMGPAPAVAGRRRDGARVRAEVAARSTALRTWLATSTEPLRSSPVWTTAVAFAVSLRPLWWVLRAWVLYVMILSGENSSAYSLVPYVPRDALTWLLLLALVLASVQVGRGLGHGRVWSRRTVAVVNVVTVLVLLPVLTSFDGAVRNRLASTGAYPVYIQSPPAPSQPKNGVFVDGMQVSNLFAYDAAGNPLSQVQLYDDRGRPVRTTYDNGSDSWSLPGVTEPWTFLPSQDEDGRYRWNVYPLSGLPTTQTQYDGVTAWPQPLTGEALRTPPPPFAKAPAIQAPTQPTLTTTPTSPSPSP